jgi:preprotein translocase subunit SecB
MPVAKSESGYRLQRIYVVEQEYRLMPVTPEMTEPKDRTDRAGHFGWDWRPVGPRRFEIILEVRVDPIRSAPESVRARLIGTFEAFGDIQSVEFESFLKVNGPAILFPYAREIISTMTGRGPHGAFHLNPLNVQALAANYDVDATAGAKFLKDNPAVAKTFELRLGSERSTTPIVSGRRRSYAKSK